MTYKKGYDPVSSFWGRVNIKSQDECWNWTGGLDGNGYGRLDFKGKRYGSHRLSYILSIGDIPGGMFVCHKCDNPLCCNPSHLFIGTLQDNNADRVKKGRSATGNRNGNYTQRKSRLDRAWTRRKNYSAPSGTAWCSSCKQYIDIYEFTKNSKRRDGIEIYCKKCCHERYIKNRDNPKNEKHS
jgi:hypothetical protein